MSPTQSKKQSDLLPNEQEISYDQVRNFFDRYKFIILMVVLVVCVGSLFAVYRRMQSENERVKAFDLLSKAKTADEYAHVIQQYPHSEAAIMAGFNSANISFEEGKWENASKTYDWIIEEISKTNSLPTDFLPSALMGHASVYESLGKNEDAIKIYRLIIKDHADSFQAPYAQFRLGILYVELKRIEDARQTFENLIASHPDSSWADEARQRLKRLPALAVTEKTPVPVTNPSASTQK